RPELALGLLLVAVVAVQGRHVVGDRQAGLAGGEKVLEPSVGVFGRAEAREHAHGPQAGAIARGVNAPRERRLAGQADPIEVLLGPRAVDGVELDLAQRPDAGLALRRASQRGIEPLDLPAPAPGCPVRTGGHAADTTTGSLGSRPLSRSGPSPPRAPRGARRRRDRRGSRRRAAAVSPR